MFSFPDCEKFKKRSKTISNLPPNRICKCGRRIFNVHIQDTFSLRGNRLRGNPSPYSSPNKINPITQVGYFCLNCGFTPLSITLPKLSTKEK